MQRPDDTEPKIFGSGSPEPAQDSAEDSTVDSVGDSSQNSTDTTFPNTAEGADSGQHNQGSQRGAHSAETDAQDGQSHSGQSQDTSESAPESSGVQSDSEEGQSQPAASAQGTVDPQTADEFPGAADLHADNAAGAHVDSGATGVVNGIDSEASAEAEPASEEVAAESLEEQLAERTEDLQRLSAEYANYRRRTQREKAQIQENAENGVVIKLLPILDDLDLAQQHGDMEGPLKALADKLNTVMRELNVSAFGVVGDPFNPEIHEAVQDTSTGDEKALGVVLRKGYQAGERVLRTAMVIVGDPTESADAAQP